MRSFLLVTGFLLFAPALVRAQTNAAAPAKPANENWMIAFLTPDQQIEYAKAHEKALTDNPALEDEGANGANYETEDNCRKSAYQIAVTMNVRKTN